MGKSEIVICTYRVRVGEEAAFEALLSRHVPMLREIGLATDYTVSHFKSLDEDKDGGYVYREIFEWTDKKAVEDAHHSPEVMAIWEPMGQLCEERGGMPAMQFPHFEELKLV